MNEFEFEAAYGHPYREPGIDTLVQRFHAAFEASNGDMQTAMVAVNELLEDPIPYEVFLNRMRDED